MNLVYASNENYARHLAVSMVSVFAQNQKMEDLAVYVISIGISKESRNRLRTLADRYKRTLKFVELDDLEDRFHYDIDTRGFDISAMGRLFLGDLLPGNMTRVLYLDCDTVAAQPLDELWNLDLKEYMVGAVMEPTIYETVKNDIGLEQGAPYYNSGVLLIDLVRWRNFQAEKKILDFYKEKEGRLFACDQDAINGALRGQIIPIPPQYNFFPNYRYFSYENLVYHSPSYSRVTKEDFVEAKKHPVVIHYMGDERPWIAGNLNHYHKAYDHYLEMTPWAGTPKETGKEWYMLAYHLMDYGTVLWPELRWIISRRFGMKLVDARNKTSRQGNHRQGEGRAAKTMDQEERISQ